MKRLGLPLTRESYLELAYAGNVPRKLSGEEEALLPEQFQQWDRAEDDLDNESAPEGEE